MIMDLKNWVAMADAGSIQENSIFSIDVIANDSNVDITKTHHVNNVKIIDISDSEGNQINLTTAQISFDNDTISFDPGSDLII